MANFDDVVNEVIALCGNRRENRALFESAVNQAILALWNKHVGYTTGITVLTLLASDLRITYSPMATRPTASLVSIDVRQDLESVEGVSCTYDEDNYRELQVVRPREVLVGAVAVEREPRFWTVVNDGVIEVRPAITAQPLAWRVIGVKKPAYYTPGSIITLLPDSMRASYVALATAIAKTYLGEAEAAQSLGVLSAMLGPREVGPSGKSSVVSDLGVRPIVEV